MWKKWRDSQQAPILHGISREHYATQLFIDRSCVPHAHVECARVWGTLDRKSTLFKLIVNFFLKGVVFMFWHAIVYIELLYCVTNFELVWTWNKLAVVEIAKRCRLYSTFPYFKNFFGQFFCLAFLHVFVSCWFAYLIVSFFLLDCCCLFNVATFITRGTKFYQRFCSPRLIFQL